MKPVRDVAAEAAIDFETPAVDRALLPEVYDADADLMRFERREQAIVDRLAMREDGAEILRRRVALLDALRVACIRATDPGDWVLNKDRAGAESAILTGPGASKAAAVAGVRVRRVRPVDDRGLFAPQRIDHGAGVYSYRATFDAHCDVTGAEFLNLEAERRCDEEFTGRSITSSGALTRKADERAGALDADLRASVATLCQTKAVRILLGLARVPRAELERAWQGSGKSSHQCRFGSGYGTAHERDAGRVADQAAQVSAQQLGDEILRRCNGDRAAAAKLLKDITANPDRGFAGVDSIARLTQGWQVERAMKALREHKTYGDAHVPPAGASEPGSNG